MKAVEFRTRTTIARPRDEARPGPSRALARQRAEPERRTTGGLSPVAIGAGAAALALAGAAILNYRRGRAAEHAHPPVGRFIEVDGVGVHYVERGAGQPVVLLHGNGAMIEDYLLSGLVERLAQTYRVIAIDRPGFGYTERPRSRLWTAPAQAELMRRVAQRLGLVKPLVVGHSWGANVAVAWALAHEEELAGIVLMSGYFFPTARADVLAFTPPAIPVIGDLLRYTIAPPMGRLIAPKLFAKIFAPRPVPQRFAAGYPLALALRPWQLRASAEESAMMIPWAARSQSHHRGLRLPVAILAGEADEIIAAQSQSVRLHEEIPHSSLRMLPGLGHMIHYFAHDEIAASIDAVLGRKDQRGDAERARQPYAPADLARDGAPAAPAGGSGQERAAV